MAFPVYKPAQPLALRQLNRQFDLEQRNLSKRRRFRLKFPQKFKETVEKLLLDFGRKSTIHGMNRIFQENSNNYKRCFWILTLISALLGSIYVCLILSKRFNAGSLQTVVDSTSRPVFHIPFPELVICNANHLNWNRLEEAKRQFMPHENDTEKLRMFELVISLYDNLAFGKFKVFQALKGEPIDLVKNINFSLVFDFMTWRCDELFAYCFWRHYKMDCCKIFSKSRGEGGICWHFNTLSNEEGRLKQRMDDKYPWRVGSSGPTSALTLRVWINKDKHFRHNNEKGIMISIMEPNVWHREPFWVPANTETKVEVEPEAYVYDNETRSLTYRQRKCVFTGERNSLDVKTLHGFDYMIENCQSECRQEYLVRYCNCTVDLLFPPADYPVCQIKDFLCLAEHNDNIRFTHQPGEENYVHNKFQGMACECFRNCYSLNYVTDVRPTFLPAFMRKNKTYVDLDVHFRFETMIIYRTSLVFGWVDLMVAFGGIAGLFLGCSLISAIELLYFALVELPVLIYKELKNQNKMKSPFQQTQSLNNRQQYNPIPLKYRSWGLRNRIMASQQFQGDDNISYFKNQFQQNNAQNETLQLWSQKYYLTNKNSF